MKKKEGKKEKSGVVRKRAQKNKIQGYKSLIRPKNSQRIGDRCQMHYYMHLLATHPLNHHRALMLQVSSADVRGGKGGAPFVTVPD